MKRGNMIVVIRCSCLYEDRRKFDISYMALVYVRDLSAPKHL